LKKTIIAAALIAASTIASAQSFVGVEVSPDTRNKNTNRDASTFLVNAGTNIGQFTIDAIGTAGKEDTGSLNQTLQGRIAYNMGPVWARAGYGQQFVQGDNYNFMTYAVGGALPVTKEVALTASVEKVDAAGRSADFNAYNVGVNYALNAKSTVSAGYQITNGDYDSKGFKVGYNYKF
jgi:hypothetical protein